MSVSPRHIDSPRRRAPLRMPPLPGQSIEEEINLLQFKIDELLVPSLCIVVVALMEVWHWWTSVPPNPILLSATALILVSYTGQRIWSYKRAIRNLRLGRGGERTMEQMLESLRAIGYRVLHDIAGPDFNVDHVIIGPAGIFTIETNTRSEPMDTNAQILYDGNAIRIASERPFDDPLTQVRARARWVSSLLNDGRTIQITVRPVVVFPGCYVEQTSPRTNWDVWVIDPKALDHVLANEPRILSPALIDSTANALTLYCRRPIS